MKKTLLACLLLATSLAVTACEAPHSTQKNTMNEPQLPEVVVMSGNGYWRPISHPNVLMTPEELQGKVEHDLSQCQCGNFQYNVPTPVMMKYKPDQARLVETGRTGGCGTGLAVMNECMRARGWEPTMCSGRMSGGTMAPCPN